MDELDLLKKDWNKQPDEKKLSIKDIYPMLHKKSSSIVKTLFYISIAELVFWILINTIPYVTSPQYKERLNFILSEQMVTALTIFSYAIILLFIYLLYKSYKTVSVTDNAKKLMKSIINTRKIIRYYVIYNLVMIFISSALALVYSINHDPNLENISKFTDKQLAIFTIVSILIIGAFMLIIWLFYKLIYGFLLKRLNRNYKELEKLEV
ncbi:hypothetical protein [uncultured Algibacter sp.]|uniref:hypothetical protein n=1 Tax=uncultured Algibacter sp. TaxID=298659 RepID=UPI00260DEF08|nr:hypothetical protein [uncultured Algibacter sp.]